MRSAAVFLVLAAVGLPRVALAEVAAGARYACDVRGAAGEGVARLSVSLRRTADVPQGRAFDATAMPLWVTVRSDTASVPAIEMPTTANALRNGSFLVSATDGPATGTPPIAPTIGLRLVLDGDAPVNNGYVVIYRQQPGSHFETVGMGPQQAGLCRAVDAEASN